MKKARIYKNKAEREFIQIMNKKGVYTTKRGWPDFICVSLNHVFFVEVKHNNSHPLKKEQLSIMKLLTNHGLPCFRWDLDNKKFELITEDTKRERKPTGKLNGVNRRYTEKYPNSSLMPS